MKGNCPSSWLCLLAVVCIVLVACVDDPTAGGLPTDVPESATEPTLVLHYERQNPDDYLKWGFWIWTDGGEEGQLFKLNYQDDFGGVAMYPLSDFGAERDSPDRHYSPTDCLVDKGLRRGQNVGSFAVRNGCRQLHSHLPDAGGSKFIQGRRGNEIQCNGDIYRIRQNNSQRTPGNGKRNHF